MLVSNFIIVEIIFVLNINLKFLQNQTGRKVLETVGRFKGPFARRGSRDQYQMIIRGFQCVVFEI